MLDLAEKKMSLNNLWSLTEDGLERVKLDRCVLWAEVETSERKHRCIPI